jgi:hypothetical protein
MGDEVEPLYVFLSEVGDLASVAESTIRDRKTAQCFKRRADVREIVDRLKRRFPEWVEGSDVDETSKEGSQSVHT